MEESPKSSQAPAFGFGNPKTLKEAVPGLLVEEAQEAEAILVVDRGHGVGIADVVHPGDVLVADALDPMSAKAVEKERRALPRLGGDDAEPGMKGLEIVARGKRPGRAGRGDESGRASRSRPAGFKRLLGRRSGDLIMKEGIAELGKLVEDHIPGSAARSRHLS